MPEAAIVYGTFGQRTIFQGNSRATALAAAYSARLLYQNEADVNRLQELLAENSTRDFCKDEFDNEYDSYMLVPFDKRREDKLIENSMGYHTYIYIYMLCEFFLCDNPQVIRSAALIEQDGRYLLRRLEAFLEFIESRFDINTNQIMLRQLQWAYLFYDECLTEK